ncbi:MAG: rRNA pseudouridine synthase [Deltaproteobacteria bacterium]|nr:rRNA pseudouridine synthase [Deltaproteobacteria bacterium]
MADAKANPKANPKANAKEDPKANPKANPKASAKEDAKADPAAGANTLRLHKIIAESGLASRRRAEKLILEGRVAVNGRIVRELGTKHDPARDIVTVDSRALAAPSPFVYYMFHKPAGYLTALSDEPLGRPTIAPFLAKLPGRVFPVGRLDKDVTGFLVLTNDGELARRLMHPSFLVPKVYHAFPRGEVTGEDLRALASGTLVIEGRRAAPALASLVKKGPDRGAVALTLTEGRKRQVKRMFAAIGHPLALLKRVAYGGVPLDPSLRPGNSRPLSQKERSALMEIVGLKSHGDA